MQPCCEKAYRLGVQDGIRGNFFRYYKKNNHSISLKNYFNDGKFVFECSCGLDNMNKEEASVHKLGES
jgi:hypothetical protein